MGRAGRTRRGDRALTVLTKPARRTRAEAGFAAFLSGIGLSIPALGRQFRTWNWKRDAVAVLASFSRRTGRKERFSAHFTFIDFTIPALGRAGRTRRWRCPDLTLAVVANLPHGTLRGSGFATFLRRTEEAVGASLSSTSTAATVTVLSIPVVAFFSCFDLAIATDRTGRKRKGFTKTGGIIASLAYLAVIKAWRITLFSRILEAIAAESKIDAKTLLSITDPFLKTKETRLVTLLSSVRHVVTAKEASLVDVKDGWKIVPFGLRCRKDRRSKYRR